MKKPLAAVVSVSLFLMACKKEKPQIATESPVLKTIEYRIFNGRESTPDWLKDVTADLTLQIRMRNLTNGQETVLWDSTSTRKRIEYPLQNNPVIIKKQFPVLTSKEKLVASYRLILSAPLYAGEGLTDELGKEKESTLITIEL